MNEYKTMNECKRTKYKGLARVEVRVSGFKLKLQRNEDVNLKREGEGSEGSCLDGGGTTEIILVLF